MIASADEADKYPTMIGFTHVPVREASRNAVFSPPGSCCRCFDWVTRIDFRVLQVQTLRSTEARRLAALTDGLQVRSTAPAPARKDRDQAISGYAAALQGVGRENPEQLWETTMDPEARTLLQVRVDQFDEVDEVFTKLMGDGVEPRREFIQTNALNVANLDFEAAVGVAPKGCVSPISLRVWA